ncbi:MAG: PD-(D/E)XK nuclease family protein [Patescibacteria group bacterium UBA2163]
MARKKKSTYPIEHWSYSSLLSFLRNPLAWHKRYVERIYDIPAGPAAAIGRAGHKALEHFYSTKNPTRADKERAIGMGLAYLQAIPDFEINFGVAKSLRAQKVKRKKMEEEYLRAIGYYLKRAPRHDVRGVEVMGLAKVPGIPLPIKAVSDLVVTSPSNPGALDIIDHKFVDSFSELGGANPLFTLQALFNYYTVQSEYEMPIKRFIFQECKKKKNRNGKSQMRRHVIHFDECQDDFALFHRLLKDATDEIGRPRAYLPNPSDMFEGKDSFEIYRMDLINPSTT